ncbi:MAG TPA: hypothetical protein VM733_11580 [Thermoanaerobaculia bacterium]|nr:hypothetical protein [Thermoanaerobaculia bacterium]
MAEILIAFVLFFYVPTLLFRFMASRKVDLSRRKIANQIEDFFAAALPSVMLNALAWLALNTVTLWKLVEFSANLPLLLTSRGADVVQQNLLLINSYYVLLLVLSAVSGYVYGFVEYQITYYGVDVARDLPGEGWRFALWYHDLWAIFFDPEKVMLYPFTVQPTWVFVRTDRLYHGLLHKYDKNSDGEITGITLVRPGRFSLKQRDEWLASDEDLVTPFTGTLWIRWSTITDINIADVDQTPKTLNTLIAKYNEERQEVRARVKRSRIRRFFRLA